MKIYDLLSEVRLLLNDVSEPYLWSDEELLSYYRDTLADIYRIISLDSQGIDYSELSIESPSTSDETHISDIPLLKYGIAYKAYMKQDSDIYDERAVARMKQEFIDRLAVFKMKRIREDNRAEVSPVLYGLL